MGIKISSIDLQDFRSFESATLKLDSDTVLVGANNVGKTNILEAVGYLTPEKQFDLPRDLRRQSTAPTPEIIYAIEFEEALTTPLFGITLPKRLLIKKNGDWQICLEDKSVLDNLLAESNYLKNETQEEIARNGKTFLPGKYYQESLVPEDIRDQLSTLSRESVLPDFIQEANETVKSVLPYINPVWQPKDEDFITEENPVPNIIGDPNLPISKLLTKAIEKDPSLANYQTILGSGVLPTILTYCEKVSVAINRVFEETWRFKPSIKLKITSDQNLLRIYFDQGEAGFVEPKFSSDGMVWLISFFIKFGMSDLQEGIVLLDQPGDALYPGGQKDLVKLIERIAKTNQVIYTTHSPFMIGKSKLGRNVRIISKPTDQDGNQKGSSEINNEIKETDIRQSDLLTNALGFYWTDFVPVGEFNILMEGKLDSAIVIATEKKKILNLGKTDIDFDRVVVRAVRGARNMTRIASEVKADAKGVFCVFDGDWTQSTPGIEKTEKINLSEINSAWIDIEDLVPKEYIEAVFESLNKDFGSELVFDQKELTPKGLGKKLKTYIREQENTLEEKNLVDEFELRLIDHINLVTESEESLPDSFSKLNGEIIKHIRF